MLICALAWAMVRKGPRAKRFVSGFLALVLVGAIFAPMLWTIAWHVWHGNHIQFEGKTFHVPFRWVATSIENQGLLENRLEIECWPSNVFSAELVHGRSERISIDPQSFTGKTEILDQELKTWRSLYWFEHPGEGSSEGPVRFRSASQDVVCFQSEPAFQTEAASASCLFLQSRWTADFYGYRKHLQDFFEIVRSAK